MYLSVHFYKIGNTIFLAMCKTKKNVQKIPSTKGEIYGLY